MLKTLTTLSELNMRFANSYTYKKMKELQVLETILKDINYSEKDITKLYDFLKTEEMFL